MGAVDWAKELVWQRVVEVAAEERRPLTERDRELAWEAYVAFKDARGLDTAEIIDIAAHYALGVTRAARYRLLEPANQPMKIPPAEDRENKKGGTRH